MSDKINPSMDAELDSEDAAAQTVAAHGAADAEFGDEGHAVSVVGADATTADDDDDTDIATADSTDSTDTDDTDEDDTDITDDDTDITDADTDADTDISAADDTTESDDDADPFAESVSFSVVFDDDADQPADDEDDAIMVEDAVVVDDEVLIGAEDADDATADATDAAEHGTDGTDRDQTAEDARTAAAESGNDGTGSEQTSDDDAEAGARDDEPTAPQAVTDVVDANAARVNETLDLARRGDGAGTDTADAVAGDGFAPAIPARRAAATTVSTRIDRELGIGKEDEILLKSNPTFAFDAVTYRNRRTGRDVVDRLSLAFQAGGVYAVLVPDDDDELRAALVGLMGGLLAPTGGSVMNRSANYMQLEPSELRGHRVGLIPQRFAVRNDLTAAGNVVYAMDASGRTFLKPKPVLARELLAAAGLDAGCADDKVGTLSEADRRRVAIARAICCEAQIIVADEPTGGLDAEDRDAIIDTLRALATGDPQRCVIIVTADRAVAALTDRTVEL